MTPGYKARELAELEARGEDALLNGEIYLLTHPKRKIAYCDGYIPSPTGMRDDGAVCHQVARGVGRIDAWNNWEPIPAYTQDLNAMHEAEKELDGSQMKVSLYCLNLMRVSLEDGLLATARQRAEAFVLTMEKL